jgi:hypothetical protein
MATHPDGPPMISLADHPRAAFGVRRAKALGGLLSFAVAGLASHLSGMSLDSSALRALAAGVIGYMVTWALAVGVWRAIMRAQARTAVERAYARRQAQIEARAQAGRQ